MNRHFVPAYAVLLVLSVLSLPSLVDAWQHAPYDQGAGIVFLLWFAPLVFLRFTSRPLARLLLSAMVLAMAGLVLGELRLCYYFALALATSSFLPWNRFTFAWLLSSLSWMPLFGILGSQFGATTTVVEIARFALIISALVLLAPHRSSHPQLVPDNA